MRGKPRVLLLSPLKAGLIPAHAGKTLLGVVFTRARGLIPAHAGKTTGAQLETASPEAHPRACGENLESQSDKVHDAGSSPRMRGKPEMVLTRRLCLWAHPRACGENVMARSPYRFGRGSSPRMRGKPMRNVTVRSRKGLIPAHAGKTRTLLYSRSVDWAHPRACGENWEMGEKFELPQGSSPRMRGKRFQFFECCYERGLIPAHAGKTVPLVVVHGMPRAHPRACGENAFSENALTDGGGSSPRMRGKQGSGGPRSPELRLIPAHAGKTKGGKQNADRKRAHPRACGENSGSRPSRPWL